MSNKVLGNALKEALSSPNRKYPEFIWKGRKVKIGDNYVQESERIDEMSESRLKECYKHCIKMLTNDEVKTLGRYNVLEEVNEQINKCNVELFLRYCENAYLRREGSVPIPRFKMNLNIRSFIMNSEEEAEKQDANLDWNTISINHMISELPAEFNTISIQDALEGCIDCLGVFNKQHLTLTFLTKMGIWFTKAEENELKAPSNAERLKLAKEKLHLPDKLVLRFSEKGLSYKEMRAMLIIPSGRRQKYSDMTTEQLVTLKNKVLPRLQVTIDNHIKNWKKLKKQIEIVAKNKGIDLND